MNRLRESRSDFEEVVKREPGNKSAKLELNQLDQQFEKLNMGSKSNTSSTLELREMRIIAPIQIPQSAPSSRLEFERVWRELIGVQKEQFRLEYLMTIGIERIRTLLREPIESDMFEDILAALDIATDQQFSLGVLEAITKSSRFELLVLFLGDKEKQCKLLMHYAICD